MHVGHMVYRGICVALFLKTTWEHIHVVVFFCLSKTNVVYVKAVHQVLKRQQACVNLASLTKS